VQFRSVESYSERRRRAIRTLPYPLPGFAGLLSLPIFVDNGVGACRGVLAKRSQNFSQVHTVQLP
jgi:hypothetical protein